MSGAGLRNWRGEIIQPKAFDQAIVANLVGNDTVDEGAASVAVEASTQQDQNHQVSSLEEVKPPPSAAASSPDERRPLKKKVVRKDEFGRDVEVTVEEKHSKRGRKESSKRKDRKSKHKKHRRSKHRDESRSASLQGRLVGTPPPADPFRPQLDETRFGHSHRRHRQRSRSRNRHDSRGRKSHRRSRSASRSRSPERHRRHYRSSPGNRSRSRGRGRSRSRSPTSRPQRRHSSASVERKWTHNAFTDRSPSPLREVNPLYRPEPETWVSRAGGVYLSRK